MKKDDAAGVVQREAIWFESTTDGMAPLLEAIGDARLVLIGEATHGSHVLSHALLLRSVARAIRCFYISINVCARAEAGGILL